MRRHRTVAVHSTGLALAVALLTASAGRSAGTLYTVLHDGGTSAERLASVAPATAALTALGAGVASCCGVGNAVTIDPAGNVLYFVGSTTAGPAVPRLFRFDTQTGADLSAGGVALDPTKSYNFIEWDASTATLFGLVRPGLTSTEQLVTIQPTTGALTNVGSAIATCCSLQSASSALGNGQLYFTGSLTTDAVNTVRLFSIGLASGAITANPLLNPAKSYIHLAFDPDTTTVFAMTHDTGGGSEQVAAVNPSTGALTPVGAATANCCSTSGTAAYDASANVFYFTGGFTADAGAIRLFGVSTATGAVVSSPLWPAGNNYNFLEFDLAPPAPPPSAIPALGSAGLLLLGVALALLALAALRRRAS